MTPTAPPVTVHHGDCLDIPLGELVSLTEAIEPVGWTAGALAAMPVRVRVDALEEIRRRAALAMRCGECRLGLGRHEPRDPYCDHYRNESTAP